MDDYEKSIAQINVRISHSGERTNGLANNLNRSVSVLMAAHPRGLPAADRDVLLSFEALCVESLWRTAWLLHQRQEHDAARHCLEIGRALQETVELATR
jgi:hypothetical protein